MSLRRVVVTGLGALTPVGNSVSEFWNGLTSGKSGSDLITRFDSTNFKTKFACEVKNFDVQDIMDRKEARRMDPFVHYAIASSDQAIKDAGIEAEKLNANRLGVIWASGIGGLDTFFKEVMDFSKTKVPRFNPFFIPKMIIDISAGHLSIRYGFKGLNFSVVSACASSTNAMIDAFNYIRLGKADIILTGGSEAAVTETGVGGFNAMK
ncbi:MAG TPA: beta-ketoacyl-[acyl-carrier-protein] synthase II, partial [Bacteroidetes bacterium]|nr:beta-ketoacyl-[acyl-carrier-protein] synthase II [Bacteroidota bacterium]